MSALSRGLSFVGFVLLVGCNGQTESDVTLAVVVNCAYEITTDQKEGELLPSFQIVPEVNSLDLKVRDRLPLHAPDVEPGAARAQLHGLREVDEPAQAGLEVGPTRRVEQAGHVLGQGLEVVVHRERLLIACGGPGHLLRHDAEGAAHRRAAPVAVRRSNVEA